MDNVIVDVTNSSTLNEKQHRVITIFNKTGLQDINAYTSYSNNERVKDISATIYNALGLEIEKFKKRDFKDVSAVDNGTLYSDNRVLYMEYTPTTYPFTVVFDKETESKSSAFIPAWRPMEGFYSSTQNSKYTILFDSNNKPSFKLYNFDGITYNLDETETSMTFSVNEEPSILYEKYAPTYSQMIPYARFALADFALEGYQGKANTWEEFGRWMDTDLIQDSNDLDDDTKAFIKNLVASKTTDEEKARAIYQYVQDKVRYIGIQIEIGGWRPMKASQVNALGYGDCKALTLYTKSLMDAVGLSSYYTIVYSDETKKDIDEELLAVQGNHAILGVELDNDITWLECTSQQTPFGYIGNSTDDRQVLMIKDNAGVFKRTKAYSIEENKRVLKATVKVDLDKSISGTATQTSEGIYYGEKLWLETYDSNKIENYYKSIWSHVNRLAVDEIILNNDRNTINYEENINFSALNYTITAGKDIILKPNIFSNHSDDLPSRYEDRQQPFVVSRSKQELNAVTFQLPEGYTITTLPEAETLITPFATFKMSFKKGTENTMIYESHLIFNEGVYDATSYEAYREFYKTLIKLENQKILISKAS